MASKEFVIVAIAKTLHDFEIVKQQHWYRIPVGSQKKWLSRHWPPKWIAFYFPQKFGNEKYSIRYYAQILEIHKKRRFELFPNEGLSAKNASKEYYQLVLGELLALPKPILSRRRRRLVFIPTTFQKFMTAVEINDLYDESPLEDRLWAEMKRYEIEAERQYFVKVEGNNYTLDFALFCEQGNVGIEADGNTWHVQKERHEKDRIRDNDFEINGWHMLRFNSRQIREQTVKYCIPTIAKEVNALGGIKTGKAIGRLIQINQSGGQQLSLFD